jgi:hypothetical protein
VRQEWKASAAEGAAEALGIAQARLVTAYREAMEAWRESRQEIRTKTVVECEGTGDRNRGRTTKTTLRTESPRANAALLGKAIDAAKAIYLLADGSSARAGRTITRAAVPAAPEGMDRKEMDRPAADECQGTVAPATECAVPHSLIRTDSEVHPTNVDEASSRSGKIGNSAASGLDGTSEHPVLQSAEPFAQRYRRGRRIPTFRRRGKCIDLAPCGLASLPRVERPLALARARWRPRAPAGAPSLTLSRRSTGRPVPSDPQVLAGDCFTR